MKYEKLNDDDFQSFIDYQYFLRNKFWSTIFNMCWKRWKVNEELLHGWSAQCVCNLDYWWVREALAVAAEMKAPDLFR